MKLFYALFLSLFHLISSLHVPYTLHLRYTHKQVRHAENHRHLDEVGHFHELNAVVLTFTHANTTTLCYLQKRSTVFTELALERLGVEHPPVTYESDNCVLTFLNTTSFDGIAMVNNSIQHFYRTDLHGSTLDLQLDSEVDRCGVNETDTGDHDDSRDLQDAKPLLWEDCYPNISAGYKLNIGIVVGSQFQRTFGKTTMAQIQSMVSEANFAYKNQMNIELAIDHLYTGPGPFNKECPNGIDKQFTAFTRWPKPSRQGLWHIIDDCLGRSSTRFSGTAYVNAICRRTTNTGISYCSGRGCSRGYKTFAHEIGHNFGARHSFEEGVRRTGGIMDYGNGFLDNLFQFNSKYRKEEICRALRNVMPRCDAFKPIKTKKDIKKKKNRRKKKQKKTKYPTAFPTARIETPYPSQFPTRD